MPSEPDLGSDPEPDPESVARTIGLRLLEARPRTRSELATAMARRGVPEDVADTVLTRFTEVGLIDDAEFAHAWVDSRHRGRGLPRRALAAELRRKGVDPGIVDEALESVSTDDEAQAAAALVRRRLRSMSGLPRDVQLRRLVGMLNRKGFGGSLSYAVARRALEEVDGSLDAGCAGP
jgi:regulatory protein